MEKEITQEQRESNIKFMTIYISIIIGILAMYALSYVFCLQVSERISFFSAFGMFAEEIAKGHLLFEINSGITKGLIGGILVGFGVYLFMCLDNQKNDHYDDKTVAGSGGFMSKKQLKKYAEEFISPDPPAIEGPVSSSIDGDKGKYSENMIMNDEFCRPINSRRLIGNNNILIVGGAGTGKSRFFIKPNVLQMNASYVITDPSGEMIYSLGKVLVDHGYKIKIFNISDMAHSNCYNPLEYIRDEAGVNMLIQCFITNTTQGEGGGDNQFFVDAEKLLYSACIFYLRDYCTDRTLNNFAGIMDMVNSSSVNEMDPNAASPIDRLFDKLPHSSLAWKYYKAFKQAAGKTLKSIIISCVTRLQPFMTPQVVNLTKRDELELDKIGKEKTALFIITPQADRTYSFLASMLYSQLFETLYYIGEQQKAAGKSEQMDIPVRCMMDEFANIGEVPEFPSKLATMRKYNISASIVLQDISQIEAMYEDNWKTLVGNCSTLIFLGTQEPNTLKYFSEMLGEQTVKQRSNGRSFGKQKSSTINNGPTKRAVMTPDELGRMPSDECIVFTQNRRPTRGKKYKYERHPYYSQTADANDENGFKYNTLSAYNNKSETGVSSIMKAMAVMNDVKTTQEIKRKLAEAGELNNAADILELDKKEEKRNFDNAYNKCMNEIIEHYEDAVCILEAESISTKRLKDLVTRLSGVTNKYPLIVCLKSDLPKREDYMIAFGIAKEDNAIEFLMNTRVTQDLKKNGLAAAAFLKKEDFEIFKQEVIENVETFYND